MQYDTQPEYNYICGVCGWKFKDKPIICNQCGNDVEFELLRLKYIKRKIKRLCVAKDAKDI